MCKVGYVGLFSISNTINRLLSKKNLTYVSPQKRVYKIYLSNQDRTLLSPKMVLLVHRLGIYEDQIIAPQRVNLPNGRWSGCGGSCQVPRSLHPYAYAYPVIRWSGVMAIFRRVLDEDQITAALCRFLLSEPMVWLWWQKQQSGEDLMKTKSLHPNV